MDYFRRFLQAMRMTASDEKLGEQTAVYPSGPPVDNSGENRRSSVYQAEEMRIETSEKLMEFRLLIGITTHASFKAPRGFANNQRPIITTSGRPAPNRGIYACVVDNEVKQKKNYKRFSIGINACLGLQIIVAAALTALGAANGNHKAVTVFGAINTVIAGFLTYLKGSGLPGRLQYFTHEWTKVREYIEQRERDLSVANDIDLDAEVRFIRQMFEDVREEIEANRPDRFIGLGGPKNNQTSGGPVGLANAAGSTTPLRPELARMDSRFSDGLLKMKEKVSGLNKEMEAYGSAASSEAFHARANVTDDLGRLKSRLREKMSEIETLEKDIESHSQNLVAKKQAVLQKGAQDKVKEMADLEKAIESYGREEVGRAEREVEVTATDAAVDASGRIKATLEVKDPSNREEKREL